MKININHLYQFFLAAREGSIKQAARILHVTEPTVSKQIRDFEDFIEFSLFDRTNRKINLTAEGRTVAEKAEKIFQLVTELEYALGQKHLGATNQLNIGTMHLLHHKIDWVLEQKFIRNQDCLFSFKHGDFENLLHHLEAQRIDLMLADYPYVANNQQFRTFKVSPSIPLVAVGTRAYLERNFEFPRCLDRLPLIAMDPTFKLQVDLDYYCQLNGIKLNKVLSLQCPNLIRRAAQKGSGVAILPYPLVKQDVKNRKLFVLSKVDFLSLECWLITLSARSSESIIRRFVSNFLAAEKLDSVKRNQVSLS